MAEPTTPDAGALTGIVQSLRDRARKERERAGRVEQRARDGVLDGLRPVVDPECRAPIVNASLAVAAMYEAVAEELDAVSRGDSGALISWADSAGARVAELRATRQPGWWVLDRALALVRANLGDGGRPTE